MSEETLQVAAFGGPLHAGWNFWQDGYWLGALRWDRPAHAPGVAMAQRFAPILAGVACCAGDLDATIAALEQLREEQSDGNH